MFTVITWANNGARSLFMTDTYEDACKVAKSMRGLQNRTVKTADAHGCIDHWSRTVGCARLNHWTRRAVADLSNT